MGEMRNAYNIWLENLNGRELGRPRRRWENIRKYLRAIVWEVVDWIHLYQDKDQWRGLVNTVMNVWVP
jgi:hypothetical protein